MWSISQVSHAPGCAVIACRVIPGLVLAYPEGDNNLGEGSSDVEGAPASVPVVVTLEHHRKATPLGHMWIFRGDGTIRPATYPGRVLTLTTAGDGGVSKDVSTGGLASNVGAIFTLEPLADARSARGARQRWGLKQGGFTSMGQWKLSRETNRSREWNKLALLWPVDGAGAWEPELHWPVEGSLVACAPWVRKGVANNVSAAITGTGGDPPLRIRVVSNGSLTAKAAVEIALPRIPMGKTHHPHQPERYPLDTQRWLAKRLGPAWQDIIRTSHKTDPLVEAREQQMRMFLDGCTRELPLASAARKVFTATGRLVVDLQVELEDGDLAFVSAGEAWIPLHTPELRAKLYDPPLFPSSARHPRLSSSSFLPLDCPCQLRHLPASIHLRQC